MPRTSLMTLFVAAALVSSSVETRAETLTEFFGPDNYVAYIDGMPDLDQSRADVWPDYYGSGRMFCGPAAGANILNYLGLEGETGLPTYANWDLEPLPTTPDAPPATEWLNDVRYSAATELIDEVAQAMGTVPLAGSIGAMVWEGVGRTPSGTPMSDLESGMSSLLPDGYTVRGEGTGHCGDGRRARIRPREIFDELAAGNYVVIHVAPYTYNEDEDRFERSVGHYLTVTGVRRYGDDFGLWFVDSADAYGSDPDVDSPGQSTFHYEYSSLSRIDDAVLYDERDDGEDSCTRTRWTLTDFRAGNPDRIHPMAYMMVVEPG